MTYQQLVNSITSLISSPTIRTKKVHLTAGQIRTLNSAPVELIAMPGVGKFISIIEVVGILNFNSVGFDGGDVLYLGSSSDGKQAEFNGFITSGETKRIRADILTYDVSPEVFTNTPINLFVETIGDATQGDSTVDLYIAYRIITL
jgi:hypothetical protein